jgi:hypothetical protein
VTATTKSVASVFTLPGPASPERQHRAYLLGPQYQSGTGTSELPNPGGWRQSGNKSLSGLLMNIFYRKAAHRRSGKDAARHSGGVRGMGPEPFFQNPLISSSNHGCYIANRLCLVGPLAGAQPYTYVFRP